MPTHRRHTSRIRFIFASLLTVFAIQVYASGEDEAIAKMQALDWHTEPGKYQLPDTNASVTTTSDEYILIGADAHEFMRLAEGHDNFKPDAVVVRVEGPNQDTAIDYQYHGIGFVKMDDWDEHIDKDELLSEIRTNTEEQNEIRAAGYPKLHVDGWAEPPSLDKTNAVVYWAISGHDSEGGSFVNAKAMKLGRKGFTEIVWSGPPERFTDAHTSLASTLAAYEYDEGSKYANFIPGTDTVAAVGAGALAYKLITGKAAAKAGAGLLALIAIFAKKLWFLIIVPFVFLWKKLKGLLFGNKETT